MLVSRSQSRQSSRSLRVSRLPIRGTLASFQLGPTVTDQPPSRIRAERCKFFEWLPII